MEKSKGDRKMVTKNGWTVTFAVVIIVAIIISSFVVLESEPGANQSENQNTLFQISAFNTFSAGNFDGNTTYGELEKHGDFGMGTLNDLNGEMIALDGKFYQITVSGIPRQISLSEKTPYATVVFFHADQSIQVASASSYSQLLTEINSSLPDYNAIYAIRVHGFFDSAKTRSVPSQTKPYPTLAEAVKNQTTFTLSGVEGTAAGFYFPSSMEGVDFSGYHLHFITDNHLAGGHLLECNVRNATVEVDKINNYYLQIP